MKKILIIVIICFLWSVNFYGQNKCSKYYPFNKDTKFQITTYDKNEKVAAVVNYLVKDVEISNNSETATLSTEMLDDKGELIANTEYQIICKDDMVSIDFKSMMGADLLSQYKDMEIEMSGTNIELPNNLVVGQVLPDADMMMNIKMAPINMKMTMKIMNRKVVANENLTTPAGTFECHVLSYDNEFKMGLKRIGTSKQWLADGIGMVKSEEYNKKGKLMSKSVLTKFEK